MKSTYFKKQWKLLTEQLQTPPKTMEDVSKNIWRATQVLNPIFDDIKKAEKRGGFDNNFDSEGNKTSFLKIDRLQNISDRLMSLNTYLLQK